MVEENCVIFRANSKTVSSPEQELSMPKSLGPKLKAINENEMPSKEKLNLVSNKNKTLSPLGFKFGGNI